MAQLIHNEIIKLVLQKRTILIIGLLLVILIGASLLFLDSTSLMPQFDPQMRISQFDMQIKALETDMEKLDAKPTKNPMEIEALDKMKAELQVLQDDLLLAQYKYDNNITSSTFTPVMFAKIMFTGLTMFLMIFFVIAAADIVSTEYTAGTIRQLLVRPVGRWRVLLAKYLTVNIYVALLMLFSLVASFLVGLICFHNNGFGITEYVVTNGAVFEQSVLPELMQGVLFHGMEILFLTGLSFMLAVLMRNSVIAIAVSVITWVSGNVLNSLLSGYSFYKFLPMPHLNLAQYMADGVPVFTNMTIWFSLAVLAVYFMGFMVVSFTSFQTRDVA